MTKQHPLFMKLLWHDLSKGWKIIILNNEKLNRVYDRFLKGEATDDDLMFEPFIIGASFFHGLLQVIQKFAKIKINVMETANQTQELWFSYDNGKHILHYINENKFYMLEQP